MLRRRYAVWGGALCATMASLPFGAGAAGETGTWSGVLEVGALRLRLKLEIDGDGKATLFSVDQGREPRSGRLKSGTPGNIEVEFPTIKARFAGQLVSPDRMDGLFHQGGGAFPLVFERGEAALGPLPALRPLDKARLAELRHQAAAPAMGAASARKGSSLRLWVDGERQIGSGISVEDSDLWHLGSITKSMTAALVARFVEAGALRWDETVGDVLGSVASDMKDAYRGATFRHLLSHRSGLPANLPIAELIKFTRDDTADAREDRKAYARLALSMPPIGPLGTAFEYSNSGYVVVGAMLELRLGASWENLIRTHLFETLKLASAGFGAPGHVGATDQPVGHHRPSADAGLQAHPVGSAVTDNPVVLGPAGRVHISLTDLVRYLAAHRDGDDYLQPDTWRALHTPPFGGEYAMGWGVRKDGALIHSGSNTLWYADVLVNSAAGIVAAAVTNDGEMARVAPVLGKAMLEAEAAA